MKFKSALLTQASGSIGGLTFSHNQGGLYTRARSIPTNPASSRQQIVRNAMPSAQVAWRALTESVRTEWRNYAQGTPIVNSLGDSIILSNLAMFLRQYVSRAQNGVAQITTAPPTPGLAELSPVTVTRHLAQSAFDFAFNNGDAWATVVGGYMAVYQSAPFKAVNNFFKGPYRLAGHVAGAVVPPTSPFFVASLYPVESGQRFFFRVIAVDAEGRMSANQTLFLDIA